MLGRLPGSLKEGRCVGETGRRPNVSSATFPVKVGNPSNELMYKLFTCVKLGRVPKSASCLGRFRLESPAFFPFVCVRCRQC